jgi:hypothetical protein
MTGLLIADGVVSKMTHALWNNPAYAVKALSLWRNQSGNTLKRCCLRERIGMMDRCRADLVRNSSFAALKAST